MNLLETVRPRENWRPLRRRGFFISKQARFLPRCRPKSACLSFPYPNYCASHRPRRVVLVAVTVTTKNEENDFAGVRRTPPSKGVVMLAEIPHPVITFAAVVGGVATFSGLVSDKPLFRRWIGIGGLVVVAIFLVWETRLFSAQQAELNKVADSMSGGCAKLFVANSIQEALHALRDEARVLQRPLDPNLTIPFAIAADKDAVKKIRTLLQDRLQYGTGVFRPDQQLAVEADLALKEADTIEPRVETFLETAQPKDTQAMRSATQTAADLLTTIAAELEAMIPK